MIFGSVCSGIEAASVAWHPLGWRAAWFAEVDPFPSAVLAHHYPDVPNLGDMTTVADRVRAGEIAAPDVLVGGTPCQSFSVAGMRKSLADDRGNLALQFIRIADAIDDIRSSAGQPEAFILWENVPGVLSVQDNAFGTFLAGLCGCDAPLVSPNDYGWSDAGVVAGPRRWAAWRILDAQHFGLAQRRRRVFVLARGGDRAWTCADALLPIIESVRWNPAPRREAGQGTAHSITTRAGNSSRPAGGTGNIVPLVAPTLRAGGNQTGGDRPPGTDVDTVESLIPVALPLNDLGGVSHALNGKGTASGYMDVSVETFIGEPVVFDETQITHPENRCNPQPGDPSHPLVAKGRPPTTAMGISGLRRDGNPTGGTGPTLSDVAPTLEASHHGQAAALAFNWRQDPDLPGDVCHPIDTHHLGSTAVASVWAVRRLTVDECEALQGFPRGYTAIMYRGRPAADGPRYKSIGNSFSTTVVKYIGERINAVSCEPDTVRASTGRKTS